MSQCHLFIVMLTRRGAEALLLWLLGQGYRVEPAGSIKDPIDDEGPAVLLQVTVTLPRNDPKTELLDRVRCFLQERKIGYLFLLIKNEGTGGLRWARGVVEKVPAASQVPDQWDRLKQDE